jgi:hypothetical protein
MDIQKLRQAVFEKTGIRIDEIDPVFTVVALNEAVFEDMIKVYQQALTRNNGELDEKISNLVILHRKLVDASQDLVERANQAHLNAALKAATEAKADIMTAARLAVSAELEKAAAIVTSAAYQLASAGEKIKTNARHNWAIVIAQAVIGGIVAGTMILTALHFQ